MEQDEDDPTKAAALTQAEADLRRQADALREARDAVERANRARSTFLANVSHEIRTPLNAVIGTAELLGSTELTPEQRGHVEAIHVSADALLDIIGDILDFSKLEAHRMDLDPYPFHLRERIGAWARSLRPRLHGKPVALTTEVADDVPDGLVGDARLLRQVLANLLSNAIKFTAAGRIVLRVRTEARGRDHVTLEFEVEDTGIGIPPDKQQVIFKEFVQADASTTRRYGGTGLGLAIAERLVDVLGGGIGLTSEPGKGSTFHFTARFAMAAAGQATTKVDAPARADAETLGPRRILVVEDSVANQQVAIGVLGKRGHTVRVVGSGEAAVEATAGEPCDVILMDLQMPVMDGYEATRLIRQREQATGSAPATIVALTARASRGSEAYCLASGFDGYLLKPYRSRDLFEVLTAAIRGRAGPAAEAPAVADDAAEGGAGLDWDAALRAADGDRELLRKVLDGYLGQQDALLDELREALGRDDLAVVRRVAHTIAGSLRLFKSARVVALAHELEDRAQAGDLAAAARAWVVLEPELARVDGVLRKWIATEAGRESGTS